MVSLYTIFPVAEIHLHAEPFQDLAFQDLHLHLPHDLGPDLSQSLIPDNMEQGILLLQKPEVFQQLHGHLPHPAKDHLVGKYRLQKRAPSPISPHRSPVPGGYLMDL